MSNTCVRARCKRLAAIGSPFCWIHLFEHLEGSLNIAQAAQLQSRINAVLAKLTYREREILKLRFGIGDGYTYTLSEIARIFRISEASARRVTASALLRAQKQFVREELQPVQLAEANSAIASAVRVCEAELLTYFAKNPKRLRSAPPETFEKVIAGVMNSAGFQVQLTQRTRDGGKDIIAVAADGLGISTKYIVECKRYAAQNPVRVELVRSLYGVKQQQQADHAILATTSYFTKDAIEWARSPGVWNLHLRDFEAIQEWLCHIKA